MALTTKEPSNIIVLGVVISVLPISSTCHILISHNNFLLISKETESTVSDHFKIPMLSRNPQLKLPFEHLEVCFIRRQASWIWVLHLHIIITYLPDIVDYILGGRWQDVIDWMVAGATTHRHLGTSCAVSLLAIINNKTNHWVVQFHRWLYPASSSIVIEDWCSITVIWTTIPIKLPPTAPKCSNFPVGVWQTDNHSTWDWQNRGIDDWCNYQTYPFIVPRPVPGE